MAQLGPRCSDPRRLLGAAKCAFLTLAMLGLTLILALLLCAASESLPASLLEANAGVSTRVFDRSGQLVREVRSTDGKLSSRITLAQLSPVVVPALIAAESCALLRAPGD